MCSSDLSSERRRIAYYEDVLLRLRTDRSFRSYFEQEATEIPQYYADMIRKDLGPLWDWLPPGALEHDPKAYLKAQEDSWTPAQSVPEGVV